MIDITGDSPPPMEDVNEEDQGVVTNQNDKENEKMREDPIVTTPR